MKSDAIQRPESNIASGAPPEYTLAPAGNLIIWMSALSPIVGVLCELIGIALIGLPVPFLPDVIAFPLSVLFAYVDRRKLKAIGYDTSKMGPPWLVPIYLFKRARILNQKLTYFIVWCGFCGALAIL